MAEMFNVLQHIFLMAHRENINDNSEETSKSTILVPACPDLYLSDQPSSFNFSLDSPKGFKMID